MTRKEMFNELKFTQVDLKSLSEETLVAGAVVKTKDGSMHLVGDVNELLGVCDDCTYFSVRDITHIAYLFDPERS